MADKVPLYTLVHKGQRRAMSQLSNEASTIDFTDPEALYQLRNLLITFKTGLHEHAGLEERFIHPLLRERVPGAATKIEEEHVILHRKLDELLSNLEAIIAKPRDYGTIRDLGQEFYLGWNRFVAYYLVHIDYEEEMIQVHLWDLCTTEELGQTFVAIILAQSQEELAQNLRMIIPSIRVEEQVVLFRGAQAILPPPAFEAMLSLAEELLDPSRWSELADRLAIVRPP